MRVVEKAGESLKGILQRSNPLIARQCQRTDCLVCITSGKGPCDGQGVTYQIVCEKCDSVYVGELSRSIRKRSGERIAQKMKEIVYETGFTLCKRSNYISNYNNTNMWEVSIVICWAWLQQLLRMQVWRVKYVENSLEF